MATSPQILLKAAQPREALGLDQQGLAALQAFLHVLQFLEFPGIETDVFLVFPQPRDLLEDHEHPPRPARMGRLDSRAFETEPAPIPVPMADPQLGVPARKARILGVQQSQQEVGSPLLDLLDAVAQLPLDVVIREQTIARSGIQQQGT